jgi:uncharacterized protein
MELSTIFGKSLALMANVLISGGSGLVGTALSKLLLTRGYQVTVLSRGKPQMGIPGLDFAFWDPGSGDIDKKAISKADFIIHLAGAGVAEKRWTSKRKMEILHSRTDSSALLAKALGEIPNKVRAVISASAIGWYGPDPAPAGAFVESDPPDSSYLGETCRLWESSIARVADKCRLVILRTGIVLSNNGGALAEFKKPLQFGIATILGNGRQVVSWIHLDDLCRIFLQALENEQMKGVYNAVAPLPVTNRELIMTLAGAVRGRRFLSFRVPAWLLKLMMGEMSVEVLKSTRVSAEKITSTGFIFSYPDIGAACRQLAGNS